MIAPLVEASYRNSLEAGVGEQLTHAKVPFEYEPIKLEVNFPARTGKYTPDFVFKDIKVLIETKGKFFDSAADRQKLILVRDQHPDWEIWLLFQNPKNKIYKGSKTTYMDWATDKGFKAAGGKVLPPEWIRELRERVTDARSSPPPKKEARSRCRSTNSSRGSTK